MAPPPRVVTLLALLAFATACDDHYWWNCRDTFVVGGCLYAKFNAAVRIIYPGGNGTVQIDVPRANDSGVKLSYADSSCFKDSNESVLDIDWTSDKGANCSLQLRFLDQTTVWYLYAISVQCSSQDFTVSGGEYCKQSIHLPVRLVKAARGCQFIKIINKLDQPPGLFQQPFPRSYYYYCDSQVQFQLNSSTVVLEMSNARLYPFAQPAVARKWLCYKDAVEEGRLVPIIVGAIIGFLMVVIFFAYLAAFTKRKCAEHRSQNTYVALGSDI